MAEGETVRLWEVPLLSWLYEVVLLGSRREGAEVGSASLHSIA